MKTLRLGLTCVLLTLAGCASVPPTVPAVTPDAQQIAAAAQAGINAADLTALINKPLFQMKPDDVGRYLAYLQILEPSLRARIAHLGRKNIGQPYEIYLLGEFPYETIDDQPLFSLEKSDCVVFAEHTYAMAMAQSWSDFFWLLQRIRYRDGVIGITTRNHYTETDWNPQNRWLVTDVSATLDPTRTANYPLKVDRTKFFRDRYKIRHEVPLERTVETYIPKAFVADISSQLQEGDFVNVISGKNGGYWASHVGIVVLGANGERHFLHSSEPAVREETFEAFINRATERESRQMAEGKPGQVLAGFKFLRLNENPVAPPMMAQPRPVALPRG